MAPRRGRHLRHWQQQRYRPPSGIVPSSDILLFDDFNGDTLDTNIWLPFTRDGDRVNVDANVVREQNAIVSGGNLGILCEHIPEGVIGTDLLLPDEERFYASAQVASKQSFLYGIFEARIRTAGGVGMGPLFWMLADGWKPWQPYTANDEDYELWPSNAAGRWEIDLWEQLGGARDNINCAVHCYISNPLTQSNTLEVALPFNSNSRFMVIRVVWRPTYIQWWLDAEDGNGFVLMREVTDLNNIPTNPGYIMAHVEMGAFYGAPTPTDYPLTVLYDWIRVRR